ncbi:hypothetical protein QBC46DRAFT_146206 [Diplogelasinospora grovesii]|uniref:NADPH:adrenodoxin oxidoreductase, mitochondrial n=1 Tax=Diplogelasinospora grovesii TaxID=303347 RepID=A0AAN6NFD7_9PEZI|nr:hypothetical protein QBC46DRAFT_146206 [Diplogelasinospora grovesii]
MSHLRPGCSACARFLRRPHTSTLTTRRLLYRHARYYSEAVSSRNGRPFRMAVIGSGPAGFYTAYRVMSKIRGAKVDMYEALPVPFGLVRFGVAPDHPEVKNCQEKFEEVAASPDFTFIGNVSVGNLSDHPDGSTIPLSSLLRHYNAVVFSYGSSKDRMLNIPGENLKGIYSAREFVGWYNGLPEHSSLNPDLTQGDEAVIIGQGNVALDVARMLLEDVDVLRKTDIAEHALQTLSESKVRRVHVVGRRGPMQAAFTNKEIRELMRLSDVGFHPIDKSLIPEDIKSLPRASKRLMDIILEKQITPADVSKFSKSWSLDFCLSPKQFLPLPSDPQRIGVTELERTQLQPSPFTPKAYPVPTGQMVQIQSSVVFRSIGYKSVPLPEFSQIGVPFDESRGIIRNDGQGRVLQESRDAGGAMQLAALPGMYCAGWVKRGPTGVIASTMLDAFATADAIAQDWTSSEQPVQFLNEDGKEAAGWEAVKSETGATNKGKVVSWEDWQRIDSAEKERGKAAGKEREKFTKTTDMLAVLD